MRRQFVVVVVLSAILAACATEGGRGVEASSCAKENLTLVEEGVLTIGTDSPALPPWFIDDDPTNGEGFESSVAYAVAEELGFTPGEVQWVVVPFNTSFAPGEKDFDVYINQVPITEERDEAVDFSDPYYRVNHALLGFADSDIAAATTIEELKAFQLGAQVGTAGLDFINDVIQPDTTPLVYDTNADAEAAFDAGQLDGLVLDLPTAHVVAATEIEGSAVIAQFLSGGVESDEFGMLFEQGNPLRDCVNEALSRVDLGAIQQEWLSDVVDAPVIQTG